MDSKLEETSTCAECGMPVRAGEYHPFAACLMYRGCGCKNTVRANLRSVVERQQSGMLPDANKGMLGDISVVAKTPAVIVMRSGSREVYYAGPTPQEIRKAQRNESLLPLVAKWSSLPWECLSVIAKEDLDTVLEFAKLQTPGVYALIVPRSGHQLHLQTE